MRAGEEDDRAVVAVFEAGVIDALDGPAGQVGGADDGRARGEEHALGGGFGT